MVEQNKYNKFAHRTTDIPVDIRTEAVNWARNLSGRAVTTKNTVDFSTIYDNYQYRNWKGNFDGSRLTLTALDAAQNPITNEHRTVVWKAKANRHMRLTKLRKF